MALPCCSFSSGRRALARMLLGQAGWAFLQAWRTPQARARNTGMFGRRIEKFAPQTYPKVADGCVEQSRGPGTRGLYPASSWSRSPLVARWAEGGTRSRGFSRALGRRPRPAHTPSAGGCVVAPHWPAAPMMPPRPPLAADPEPRQAQAAHSRGLPRRRCGPRLLPLLLLRCLPAVPPPPLPTAGGRRAGVVVACGSDPGTIAHPDTAPTRPRTESAPHPRGGHIPDRARDGVAERDAAVSVLARRTAEVRSRQRLALLALPEFLKFSPLRTLCNGLCMARRFQEQPRARAISDAATPWAMISYIACAVLSLLWWPCDMSDAEFSAGAAILALGGDVRQAQNGAHRRRARDTHIRLRHTSVLRPAPACTGRRKEVARLSPVVAHVLGRHAPSGGP